MNSEGFKRKLTAILSADVVGYSRLMADDDDATVSTLTGHREMMSTLIKQHQGRVVDSPGDNLLAEFESVLQSVNCAVEIQRELAERNAELPENRKMEYRIGVNLGDVIKEGERIYGDGVNIAARLESLAAPGGICISGFVYNQVKNRLKLEYEFIGKQSVKNIREPIAVFRVLSFPGAAAKRVIEARKSVEKEMVALSFQDKPSVAVLPFVNMSNDPEQEYFSDGMAEELIGALAKLDGLKVISRTSAFHFKGKDVDLRAIGEKLNVEHVLEGSVRKAGNKLRISAQLIKVDDDTHLWAETYDRELEDVFAIQDEISQAVVENLKVVLLEKSEEPLVKDYTKNTEAYKLYLRGMYFWNKGFLGWQKSIEYLEKAIKSDTEYLHAYVLLADVYYGASSVFSILPPNEMWQKVKRLIQKAFEIDGTYFWVQLSQAWIKGFYDYKWEELRSISKKLIELYPGLVNSYWRYAVTLIGEGRVNEAIKMMKLALELDPFSIFYNNMLGLFLILANQFDQAIIHLQKTLELAPNDPQAQAVLAYADAGMGKYNEGIKKLQPFRNVPLIQADLGYLCAKAGRKEEAQQILYNILDRSKRGYFSAYFTAIVYTGLGDKDNAFEQIERVYQERDTGNWLIRMDPIFTDLHSDPRWDEQMKKRGLAD